MSGLRQHQILLRFAPKHFNGVRVAGQQKRRHFSEAVHDRIGFPVFRLLELRQPQQFCALVQGNAPDVDIGCLDIGAIGVAPTQGKQHNPVLEGLVFPKKIVIRASYKFSDVFQVHNVYLLQNL